MEKDIMQQSRVSLSTDLPCSEWHHAALSHPAPTTWWFSQWKCHKSYHRFLGSSIPPSSETHAQNANRMLSFSQETSWFQNHSHPSNKAKHTSKQTSSLQQEDSVRLSGPANSGEQPSRTQESPNCLAVCACSEHSTNPAANAPLAWKCCLKRMNRGWGTWCVRLNPWQGNEQTNIPL